MGFAGVGWRTGLLLVFPHMHAIDIEKIDSAQLVLPCADLAANLEFFTGILHFRTDAIYPADSPRVAVLSGFGTRIRLESGNDAPPGRLRLISRDEEFVTAFPADLAAPNGTIIDVELADAPLALPPFEAALIVQKVSDEASWGTGRAGMQYRDLIPGRLGGGYIASHIRIPDGGPVPDYVHHHHVLFQLIYCYRGWVRLVYEDQGPPFIMEAGDCVLQPPHIRHRVLECSDGFEVVEVGCPAEHATLVDHDMELPTSALDPDRDFAGQRFIFHRSADASWESWRVNGFEMRDTGIASSSGNVVSVVAVRPATNEGTSSIQHDGQLLFDFVLEGSMTLNAHASEPTKLAAGDSFAVPPGLIYSLSEFSDDLRFLEISSPAEFRTTVDANK